MHKHEPSEPKILSVFGYAKRRRKRARATLAQKPETTANNLKRVYKMNEKNDLLLLYFILCPDIILNWIEVL